VQQFTFYLVGGHKTKVAHQHILPIKTAIKPTINDSGLQIGTLYMDV
jgi:hypothetical protein